MGKGRLIFKEILAPYGLKINKQRLWIRSLNKNNDFAKLLNK